MCSMTCTIKDIIENMREEEEEEEEEEEGKSLTLSINLFASIN